MFTPAQTTVTRSTIEDILADPSAAIEAHTTHSEPLPCEQVTVIGWDRATEQQIYLPCSSTISTHMVSWTDSLGADKMPMCVTHAEEFVEEAETNPEITGYSIDEIAW